MEEQPIEQPTESNVVQVVTPQSPSRKRRWGPRIAVWVIILALLVTFVAQNLDRVDVQLLAWEIDIRLAWVLLIAGALGLIIGLLAPFLRRDRS